MKHLIYSIVIIIGFSTLAQSAEKKDCSGIKKLSKAFIACKTGNFNASIVNTGSVIKKNTIGKVKIKNKKKDKSSTIDKVKKTPKEIGKSVKNRIKGVFGGVTKQYPKGVKK